MPHVSITIRPTTVDIFAVDQGAAGILSDEHPASSDGMPLVLIDGQPVGVQDVPVGHEIVAQYTYGPSTTPDIYEAEDIRARRSPAQVALAQAAQQAGYPIINP